MKEKRSCRIAAVMSILLLLLAGCSRSGGGYVAGSEKEIPLRHSRLLRMSEGDGYVKAEVVNPWDTTLTLHTYILAERDDVERQPGATFVRVPLRNALIAPSAHLMLASDLGAISRVGGVLDSQFMIDSVGAQLIREGKIADCGNNMTPDIEKVIRLNPDAILLSPYHGQDNYGRLSALGVPVIECADYMENSPLARAEWVKFYSILFGERVKGEKMFDDTERRYETIKLIAGVGDRCRKPKVIFDMRYGQTWFVPARRSTTGIFINDAGGVNPFDNIDGTGGVAYSPEKVLAEAGDADIWFVRLNSPYPLTLAGMKSDFDLNSRFKAWKEGNVYVCDTSRENLFDAVAFHPDEVLESMVVILHPELQLMPKHKYYYRVE